MKAQLSEFSSFVQGGRHKKSGKHFVEKGYPAYGAGGMNGFLADFEFEKPAIVLSSIGARCGKCFLPESSRWSSLANTQLIFPDERKADIRFIWYQLNDEESWIRRGTGQPYIRPSDVKEREVYFPALDEQRRIAAILDKADAIRRKRQQALAFADEFLKSVFLEMFGDLELNRSNWPTCKLESVLKTEPQNGLYRPARDYGSGTRILRIDGFYSGYLTNPEQFKRVRLDGKTVEKYQLNGADIVVNRVNSREYLGKSALVEGLNEPTVFESNMMRFSVKENKCNPRFLVDQLQSQFIKRQILRASKDAVNQSSINQGDVLNFEIRLPPVELQDSYAEFVSAKLKQAFTLNEAQLKSEHLFASLSQRAFRGEL